MTVSPSEVVTDLDMVSLNNEVTKGLVPDQVLGLKERVIEVNEELITVGQSVRSIAANLSEIKKNIKGNWKAFINSGAVNMSPKACQDLVSAHDRWLEVSNVEDHLLAPFSYRSLAVLGGTDKKPVSENQRQKVFELVEAGEKVTEATVRRFVQGRTKSTKKVEEKADNALTKLKTTNSKLAAENKKLRAQNIQLKKMLVQAAVEGVTPTEAAALKV